MSHYKPYPVYKDSCVEWLGRVPAHWMMSPLKYFIAGIESGTSVNAIDTPAGESELGVLKTSCVYSGKFDPAENKAIVPEEYERAACPLVVGSLIVSRMNTPDLVGAAGLVCHAPDGIFLPDRLWQVSFSGLAPSFAYYWSQSSSYRAQVKMVCTGSSSSMQNLTQDQFKDFVLGVPAEDEQQLIAAHLDRETARIDTLIEKKTRFIELLREKMLSLIGQAFGCEESRWVRLQHVSEVISRPLGREEEKSYVRLGLYNRGRGIFKKEEADAEDMGDSEFFWVEPGDLILSGQFAWEGAVALADIEHKTCVVSHRYPVIRGCVGEVLTEYLFAFFLSHYGDFLLNDCSRGSAGRNRPLNIVSLLKWEIPVPPMELQEKVASLVRYRRELMQKVESSIALLKEHRSALITAAVTGQIDLRKTV